jgi:hypothetical protein
VQQIQKKNGKVQQGANQDVDHYQKAPSNELISESCAVISLSFFVLFLHPFRPYSTLYNFHPAMPVDEPRSEQHHRATRKSLSSSVLVETFNAMQSPITYKTRSFNNRSNHNKTSQFLTPPSTLSNQVKLSRATSQSRIVSFFDHSHNFLPSWLGRSQQNTMGNYKIVAKSRSSNSVTQKVFIEDIVTINNINAQFELLLVMYLHTRAVKIESSHFDIGIFGTCGYL